MAKPEEFFDYGYNSNQEESDEHQGTTHAELSYQELNDLCKEVKETIKQVTRYVREKAGQDNVTENISRFDRERGRTLPRLPVLDKRKESIGRSASQVPVSEWDLLDAIAENPSNRGRRRRR